MRTFHVGGTASKIADESKIEAKYDGKLEIDELRTVKGEDSEGNKVDIVIGRSAEMKIIDQEYQHRVDYQQHSLRCKTLCQEQLKG